MIDEIQQTVRDFIGTNGTGGWLSLDFNEWRPHVLSALEILAAARLSGLPASYLNLARDLKVGHGQLVRGLPFSGTVAPSGIPKAVLNRASDLGILVAPHTASRRNHVRRGQTYRSVQESVMAASSLPELLQVEWGSTAIGYPAVSTTLSDFERSSLSFAELRAITAINADLYLRTYDLARRLLEDLRPAVLVLFNGRLVCEHAASEAARALGVSVLYHDASAEPNSYYASSGPVLDIATFTEEAKRAWLIADASQRTAVAKKWFEGRIARRATDVSRFASRWMKTDLKTAGDDAEQHRGTVSSSRSRVAIFPTSDHEFLAVSSDWVLPENRTQLQWLRELSTELIAEGAQVTVRLHPNLRGKPRRSWHEWLHLRDLGVRILPPEDPTDSYALMRSVDSVITCGSTTGVEAAYLGTPSISVGAAIYEGLGAVPRARSVDEVLEFVAKPPPISESAHFGLLQFGHFQATRDARRRLFPDSTWPASRYALSLHAGRFTRIVGREVTRLRARTQSTDGNRSGQ